MTEQPRSNANTCGSASLTHRSTVVDLCVAYPVTMMTRFSITLRQATSGARRTRLTNYLRTRTALRHGTALGQRLDTVAHTRIFPSSRARLSPFARKAHGSVFLLLEEGKPREKQQVWRQAKPNLPRRAETRRKTPAPATTPTRSKKTSKTCQHRKLLPSNLRGEGRQLGLGNLLRGQLASVSRRVKRPRTADTTRNTS